MKKIFLLFFFLLHFQNGFSQGEPPCGVFDFENPYYGGWCFLTGAYFDTSSISNQIWQIGPPQKVIFNSAHSSPNAIVTKLDTYYPISDTSTFIFREVASMQLEWPRAFYLSGYFKINTDTINDFGFIEFSPDNGNIWYKLSPWIEYYNGFMKTDSIFTGNSNGWARFDIILDDFSYNFNIQQGDTVAYRFTFISDSIQTNKEGWMIDDIGFDFFGEGVPEFQNNNSISIYPNPTDGRLFIQTTRENDKAVIQVFNSIGQTIICTSNFEGNILDTKQLKNGFYLLKYSDTKSYAIKQFIVQH